MASDPKATPAHSPQPPRRPKGVQIFTYPKTIFLFPTLIVGLICGCVMAFEEHRLHNVNAPAGGVKTILTSGPVSLAGVPATRADRFSRTENLVAVFFLLVLGSNLLIIAIDFPRFAFVGILLAVLFTLFFLLWAASYFHFDLPQSMRRIFGFLYAYASSGFYLSFTILLAGVFVLVYLTRWLDYWEILPNEILHHHGPLSDLERYPTMNLKFDKEIPDVFEWAMFQSGRLVLHLADERRSIVLDNVLFINSKEEALKKLMSRLDVRLTTDPDTAD